MEVFGSSGTRGRANVEITPAFAVRVAQAVGSVWEADRIAVGRDTRTTSALLAAAAASGLASVGADVVRLGEVPTPALQAFARREAIPGVMITASHNPPSDNGLKLVDDGGIELTTDALERVESVLRDHTVEMAAWEDVGRLQCATGANHRYIEEVLASLDRDRIAAADLTVAIDPGHGSGCHTSPRVFRKLGCEVVTVNAQPDGRFPGRDPEPVPEHLGDLQELVDAASADLGIAHDGDADRAILVDGRGKLIDGETMLAALAAAELEAGDVVVSAVNVSQRLVDVTDSCGAHVQLTPIGSTHLISRIRELQAAGKRVPIAGEGNGGVIIPRYRIARDGAYTAARFLELLVDQLASDLAGQYDNYHKVRENVDYESDEERAAMLASVADYASAADAEVTTIDGYRLDYGDAWVLARPSGTEPLVRISAEARTASRARQLADGMREAVESATDR